MKAALLTICLGWLSAGFATGGAEIPSADLRRYDFSGPGMATTFRISLYADDEAKAEAAVDACFKRVEHLNAVCTDYDPSSELMRICAPGVKFPLRVSAELFDLLKRAVSLAETTGGAFDPTCGHLTQLWRRTRRQGRLPPPDRLHAAMAATNWRRIFLDEGTLSVTLAPGTLLDLGGIAKGYAADECLRILRLHGLPHAIVAAGGDIRIGASPPGADGWEYRIRAFADATESEDQLSMRGANLAVSTSGDLYQFVEIDGVRYSHIIDPRTGLGLTRRVACTVFAADGATSDALATAMCVLGPDEGRRLAERLPGVEVRFAAPK